MPLSKAQGPKRNRQYPAIVASILTMTVFASLVAVASPAASALTSLERQHLVAHLDMTADWLADEARQPDAGADWLPPRARRVDDRRGRWSTSSSWHRFTGRTCRRH